MRIGEMARLADVSAKTVRYYEDIGLMPEPDRHANGYREYSAEHLERLRFIKDAQAAGLSLAGAAEILELKSRGESSCAHTAKLLEQRVADVDQQIERLLAAKSELVGLLRRSQTLDTGECNDPARCQVIGIDIPVGGKV